MSQLCLSIALACLLTVPGALGRHSGPLAAAGPRIVAVGDIHGAAPGLAQILEAAGLIDTRGRWTGGTARLVQTGDFLDRGTDVRGAMDLLMRLEGEARRAGGRVDVLFGNHEGMNLLHDFRDVSAPAFATFADARSEERRRRAFDAHRLIATRAGTTLDQHAWMAAHPPGYVEYVEATGPSGQYGRWLRNRKPVLQIGDTIFMHAGLHPERTITIDEINRTVEREIRDWDALVGTLERARLAAPFFTMQEIIAVAQVEIGRIVVAQKTGEPLPEHVTPDFIRLLRSLTAIDKWALIEADGPLWYRGLATLPGEQRPAIQALLRRHGASRIVLGHTPQLPGRIRARFGGLVVLIDTGMLASYYKGGQPSALEIQDERITAVYVSGRDAVVTADAPPAQPPSLPR